MSYHRYTTESIVLGGVNLGEANRMFYLLTKDFGLIFATAQGVRLSKAKLRYLLQDFSVCKIDLVFGKNMWRVVDVFGGDKQILLNEYGTTKMKVLARVFSLARRLLHGEERNAPLFEEVNKFMEFIKTKDISFEDLLLVEGIMAARILNHLGYWGENDRLAQVFLGEVNEGKIKDTLSVKSELFKEINKALKETHL
ncbi:MAG: DNA repair protein RecO [Parcubacteria group bacterium LiPW_30]|nr:MAG: DNA repair protein RecO [Parcubacteria group bacterium LiPW_30]